MWTLWVALATAQNSVDDPTPWQDAAAAMPNGPAGCWEVVGEVAYGHDVGRWVRAQGDAVVYGRLVDGVWSTMTVHNAGHRTEDRNGLATTVYAHDHAVIPLFGFVEGGSIAISNKQVQVEISPDGNEPKNFLRSVLNSFSDAVEVATVRWDEGRAGRELNATRKAVKGNGWVDVSAFFPSGGTVPTELDVTAPTIPFGISRVSDATMSLRTVNGPTPGLPKAEAYRIEGKIFGLIPVSLRQTIRYRSVLPCAPSTPAAAQEPVVPPPPVVAPEPEIAPEILVVPEGQGVQETTTGTSPHSG